MLLCRVQLVCVLLAGFLFVSAFCEVYPMSPKLQMRTLGSDSAFLGHVIDLRGGGKVNSNKKSSSSSSKKRTSKRSGDRKKSTQRPPVKKVKVQEEDEDFGGSDDENEGIDDNESYGEEDNYYAGSAGSKSYMDHAKDMSNFALHVTKSAAKSTVDLAAVKHVTLRQITGKWRITQEVEVKRGIFMSMPATIDIKGNGDLVTTYNGEKIITSYNFVENQWPRRCYLSFQAKLFDTDETFYYKGYFKRSIMNPSIVLIRGKVYRLAGKNFWKSQTLIGKWKATKRKYGK